MKRLALVLILFASPALAAEQLDAQKVIQALQQQRNDALDKAAIAEAKAAQLADELQKLKAEKAQPDK